eukprot:scaffold31981_cov22-Prasinocladus_malaysianus.AAC.2
METRGFFISTVCCLFGFGVQLVADVGIVGIPSAGKSTLLSVLSSAKPKVINCPGCPVCMRNFQFKININNVETWLAWWERQGV